MYYKSHKDAAMTAAMLDITAPELTAAPRLLALFEGAILAIRNRRAVRLTDATGVNLASARSLYEHAEGIIRCDDARSAGAICAWDPARVERAGLRREAAARSRSIERYLSGAADEAEIIILMERNCLPAAVAFWRSSRAFQDLSAEAGKVVKAMRAALDRDLDREYGAARKLAGFFARYRTDLQDSLTLYSAKVLAPSTDRIA